MNASRLTVMLVAVLCVTSGGFVCAQAPLSSTYQPLAGAKSTWPPFYRPDPTDAKYTALMANGWCKPNGWRAQEYYKSKIVDVNTLPESSFEGTITGVQSGRITAVDKKTSAQMTLVVHDDLAVSRVIVEGKATPDLIVAGCLLRFVGTVDDEGKVEGVINQLELTTSAARHPEPVVPHRKQNIYGTILRREGSKFILSTTNSGKIPRVYVEVAPQAEVSLLLTDYRYAGAGGKVKVKGKIYRGTATDPLSLLFAEDLTITVDGAALTKATKPNVVQPVAARP
jgi:hypothetical protein